MNAVARLQALIAWLDRNPWTGFFLPPLLFLIQFLLLVVLVSYGFPQHDDAFKVPVSLLLISMFGLPFLCFGAMALGVRQAFVLESRVIPILGVVANAVYMAGFTFFFLFILVLQNLT